MTVKQKRLALILGGLGVIAAAVALVLTAFNQNLVFFSRLRRSLPKRHRSAAPSALVAWWRPAASSAMASTSSSR